MACDPIRHDCQHSLAFKSKLLNKIFYQLTSFMFSYEPIRWRWSHFRHHSHTLSVEGHYDYEIQITKPTDLFLVFLMHIPGGNILIIHKTFLFFHLETIKHAIGIVTPIMEDCIPIKERSKCRISARIHVSLWTVNNIIINYLSNMASCPLFTFALCLRNYIYANHSFHATCRFKK